MAELTEPRRMSFTLTSRPTLGVVGVLVLLAVVGMAFQGAAFFGPSAVHPSGAPVSAIPLGIQTGPGLHISPALLNSPIGIQNRAFLENSVNPHGLAPLLSQLLPQTAAPKGAVPAEHSAQYRRRRQQLRSAIRLPGLGHHHGHHRAVHPHHRRLVDRPDGQLQSDAHRGRGQPSQYL